MTAAVQAQGQVPVQIIQPPVETKASLPQPFFPRMKENAIWAWNATVEKLETVGQNLKRLLLKVVEAIRTFFGPKIESAKQAFHDLRDRFTKKDAAPVLAVAPPQAAAPQPPALKVAVEEPKVLPAVVEPEAQFFIPQPLNEAQQEERPAEVQMPVEPVVNLAPAEPAPAPIAAAAAPATPPEPEKVGIFNFWHNWWK